MAWDPDQYLRYADHRTRPGIELLGRIPDLDARGIVDLGCGTGDLTALLARRWPSARINGIDSSREMIVRARRMRSDIEWTVADIASWNPVDGVDVIFSNAALHWVDDHEHLFPRLRSRLKEGGCLAVQMPDNWDAPTHRIPSDILDEDGWPEDARRALMRDRLSAPAAYAEWLQPSAVDLWRTTYFQRISGADPVWEWVSGSLLRPVVASLDADMREAFTNRCRERYAEAYPTNAGGVTTLPFRRLFIVASIP